MTPDETITNDHELQRLLNDNPGSEVTEEQKAALDAAQLDSSASLIVDEPEPNENAVPAHDHVWRRGLKPGGLYIKICKVCGLTEDVPFSEWQSISDR